MGKKKRKLWWVWFIVLLVIAIAYWFYVSFNGSVFMRMKITKAAKNYVEENYAGEGYEVRFATYDFKIGNYFCIVESPASADSSFTVWEGDDGMRDDYDNRVTYRENTRWRLSSALDDYVESFFAENYSRRTSLLYSDILEVNSEEAAAKLELDMPFDIKSFPLPASLVVWVESENSEPTWDELAERLREIEALVREDIPCIEYFSVTVDTPYTVLDDGTFEREYDGKSICCFDVPRDVITGDGLEAYLADIRAAQEAE